MGKKNNGVTSTADREIVTSRLFDAPRTLVWKAWTDPREVALWWGPNGFTNTIHEMDVSPGGVWQFIMHGPDGVDYKNKIVFVELVKPERIVYDHVSGPKFRATVTFDDEGGKTRVTMRALFETASAREYAVKTFGAVEGAKQTLGRLDAHLAKMGDRVEAPTEGVFTVTRQFDAPRELVFKAWTECEHLMQWWGPKGFTMRVCRVDLRPGGEFHYCLRSPDGHDMWGKFVFREIVAPERLVYVVSFSDEKGGVTRHPMARTWPLEMLNTVTLSEQSGRTTITLAATSINATEEERKTFRDGFDSMRQGWGGTMDQLTAYLAKKEGNRS